MKTTDLPLFWVIVKQETCYQEYFLVHLVVDTYFKGSFVYEKR